MRTLYALLQYVKPYYRRLVWTALFNVLLALFTIVTIPAFIPFFQVLFDNKSSLQNAPGLLGQINGYFETLIETQGKPMALVEVCLFLLIVLFLKNVCRYLALYTMSPLRTGIIRDIREKLYNKMLHLPLAYYSNERKGDLMSRMTNDISEIEWSVISTIESIFRDPIILLGSLGFMVYVSPALTGISLILMILIGVVIGGISQRLRRQSASAAHQLGLVNSTLEETISGMRIIKAFNAENFMSSRFKQENDAYRHINLGMVKRRDLSAPMSEFLGVTAVVALLYIGSRQVFAGHIAPQVFLTFIFAFYSVIDPSKSLSQSWFNIQKSSAALDRIDQVLATPNEIANASHPTAIKGFNSKIEFDHVSFRYSVSLPEVLKDLSFSLNKGETIAIVGKSGSGKSTIVDLLPRFYDVTHGAVRIDGIDIKQIELNDLKNLFAVVSQEPILFHGTIEENIRFGSDATLEDIKSAARVANAENFILETSEGYQTQIGDRGQKLSGGQRQRLTLARALVKKAPILILDEATSSLDSESEKLIQEALDKVLPNMTAIIIAHRLNTIKQADKILVIDEGRLVQYGTHDQLIDSNGAYKKLLEMQLN